MTKKLIFFAFLFLSVQFLQAQATQTVEELKALKAEKAAEAAKLKGEADALQKQIDAFPGWKFGAGGNIGLNFSQFNDWLASDNSNTFTSTIGFAGNAFANLDQDKFFWRNGGNLVLSKTKLATNETQRDTAGYETSADALNITSLYGYKLNPQFAISALGEYRTTVLSNFNNPGYIDIGVGATWTPITNLSVVIHPLNYNIVLSDQEFEYQSSLGTKIVADYARKLTNGIGWKTNFSTFISYKDPSELSNWTWVNGFTTAFKGIGIGFDFGLRSNKQEFNAFNAKDENANAQLDKNPLQTYWVLGLTYNL